ncbi:Uncharacterised protein [Vibrio cholerae]|uniref:Uncharacterized protein n=1 Tax=Vibrio cholerae TaxID=666 RepID=A0A655UNX3_VIBCL|nr:Uncharacterised protein [Vibrio cholerae]
MISFRRRAEVRVCPKCWNAPAIGINNSTLAMVAKATSAISGSGVCPPTPSAASQIISTSVQPLASNSND